MYFINKGLKPNLFRHISRNFSLSYLKLHESSSAVLGHPKNFVERHIGPRTQEKDHMLQSLGLQSLEGLISRTVPKSIRLNDPLNLTSPMSEVEILEKARELASENQVWRSYIGMGFYNCHVPTVITRNVLENPGWITQYTPYQPEVSQGRLESLLNFQTMVCELTKMHVANASLLCEASACAEAVAFCYRFNKRSRFLIDKNCHPQNIAVVQTRAKGIGIETELVDFANDPVEFTSDVSGILLQYPDTTGTVHDYSHVVRANNWVDCFASEAALKFVDECVSWRAALCLLKPPGDFKMDVAIGSSQRFGVPLGLGGPHAAFFAVRDTGNSKLIRQIPGRIVGITKDQTGEVAFRLALQTREQHIKRGRATSNICTAQALLANMAAMYAIYHGPDGLRNIANTVHLATSILAKGLESCGYHVDNVVYFDTLTVDVGNAEVLECIKKRAEERMINLRYYDDGQCKIGISMDETVTDKDLKDLLEVIGCDKTLAELRKSHHSVLSESRCERKSKFLTQLVFNINRSETRMVRYLRELANQDLSLAHSMIPLGSCTMKLSSTTALMPCSFPGFANIHPFVPRSQTAGYDRLISELRSDLIEITGMDEISFQSNSGAQGEYSGLMTILAYLRSIGQEKRKVCFIPDSAHGTNPASAHMAGMSIVTLPSDKKGGVDLQHLEEQCKEFQDSLACLMITYPSTQGLFDHKIKDMCDMVHSYGGQIYLDGANMNAQVGICRPGDFNADVCHLNLHKTFSIPHGGGGPGMGPIAIKSHLAPYLPDHPVTSQGLTSSFGTVGAASFGSPLVLPVAWSYIKMLGAEGLRHSSEVAMLNANYMMNILKNYYDIWYSNAKGYVGHEFILDCREFRERAMVEVRDIAKRLQDYGFHAPTISWPVIGGLMIEPTESEDKIEMDRFCDSLIRIRMEIRDIEEGKLDMECNPLKMAPHPQSVICATQWDRPYTREQAAFPAPYVRPESKFWPNVSRVNEIFGDQKLVTVRPASFYIIRINYDAEYALEESSVPQRPPLYKLKEGETVRT